MSDTNSYFNASQSLSPRRIDQKNETLLYIQNLKGLNEQPPGLNKLDKYRFSQKGQTGQINYNPQPQSVMLQSNMNTNSINRSMMKSKSPMSRKSLMVQQNEQQYELLDQIRDDFEYLTICSKHKQDFTLYNKTTKTLLCVDCVFTDGTYKNHHIVKADSVEFELNKEILDYRQDAFTNLQMIEECLHTGALNDEFILRSMDSYQNRISEEFEKVYDTLRNKENLIKKQVSNFLNEKLRENSLNNQNLCQLRQYLLQARESEIIRSDIKDGTNYFYSLMTKLKTNLQKVSLKPKLQKDEDIHCLDFTNSRKVEFEIDNFCRFYPHPQVVLKQKEQKKTEAPPSNKQIKASQSKSQTKQKPKTLADPVNTELFSYKKSFVQKFNQTKTPTKKSSFKDFDKSVKMSPKRNISPQKNENVFTSTTLVNLNQNVNPNELVNLFTDSNILTRDLKENTEIFSVLPALKDKQITLLYRLTTQGPSSEVFHEKCDSNGPYLVLVEANNFIFGYYMPIHFISEDRYSVTDQSFIFSIVNRFGVRPLQFKIKPDRKFIALYQSTQSPSLGSSIDQKQDLLINFDNPSESCSNLGYAYNMNNEHYGPYFLAGSHSYWQVSEIEVYRIANL